MNKFPLQSGPSDLTVLKGIFPTLKGILQDQISEIREKTEISKTDPYVKVVPLPDAKKDPQKFTIDPFGNDFFCKICQQELSNIYMHCEGCESLLQKDFNICIDCHGNDSVRLKNVTMHPNRPLNNSNAGRRADYNHMPATIQNKKGGCKCKNGPVCRQCHFMICCSCKCHKKYSLRMRFRDVNEIESLLKDTRRYVGKIVADSSENSDENGLNAPSTDFAVTTSSTDETHDDNILHKSNSTTINSSGEENDSRDKGIDEKLSTALPPKKRRRPHPHQSVDNKAAAFKSISQGTSRSSITRNDSSNVSIPEKISDTTSASSETMDVSSSPNVCKSATPNNDLPMEGLSETLIAEEHSGEEVVSTLRISPRRPISMVMDEIHYTSSETTDVQSPIICKSTTSDDASVNGSSERQIAEEHTREESINTLRRSSRSIAMDEVKVESS